MQNYRRYDPTQDAKFHIPITTEEIRRKWATPPENLRPSRPEQNVLQPPVVDIHDAASEQAESTQNSGTGLDQVAAPQRAGLPPAAKRLGSVPNAPNFGGKGVAVKEVNAGCHLNRATLVWVPPGEENRLYHESSNPVCDSKPFLERVFSSQTAHCEFHSKHKTSRRTRYPDERCSIEMAPDITFTSIRASRYGGAIQDVPVVRAPRQS